MIKHKKNVFTVSLLSAILAGCMSSTPESLSPMAAPMVPTLAYDDTSLSLVWEKPNDYTNIKDFRVYQNGQPIGLASENNLKHNPAAPYIKQFFDNDQENFHRPTRFLNFKVTGLTPNTAYQFSVSAIYEDGTESVPSAPLNAVTAPSYAKVVNVVDYGALGDDRTINTGPIQRAIDECSAQSTSAYGCKVIIPRHEQGSTYQSGALFLNSNMTLEIEAGAELKGSPYAKDYPLDKGYQLYSYRTNPTDSRRPPSLLNALSDSHMNGANDTQDGYDHRRHTFENIRVVGQGTLNGNGWQRNGTTIDELGNELPYHTPGNREKVYSLGVLAKDQLVNAYEAFHPDWNGDITQVEYQGQINKDLYANRRSSLATFRGVTNFYFGELTLLNPAYHGVMFLEGENSVFAYTSTKTFDVNNADGVEFGNSTNSLVFANFIDSGDDCINFAAGQGEEYHLGNEHVNSTDGAWIFNNYTREGHGVVVAGSHTGAWIQNIVAEENVSFLTDNGLRMKSTPATGGGARNIVFRDNAMKDIGTQNSHTIGSETIKNRGGTGNPFVFTLAYKAGDNVYANAPEAAQFRDVTVQNVTLDNVDASGKAKPLIQMDAYDGNDTTLPYPETFHENITFNNVKIKNSKVTKISRMKNSTFTNVSIENWEEGKDSPWQITDSEQLTFIDVTPMPK